jgi:acetyltransferase-like isoleucine patch superfamily enzyme
MESDQKAAARDAMAMPPFRRRNNGKAASKTLTLGEVPRRERNNDCILTFGQERIWFLQQTDPTSGAYNCCDNLELSGPLDVTALRQALIEILRRHEALIALFPAKDGRPTQQIPLNWEVQLEVVDLTHLPVEQREGTARQLAARENRQPFNLETGPIFRLRLLRLQDETHWLLLTVHQIAYDCGSFGVLMKELRTLYRAFTLRESSPLPDLTVQYADYAAWQKQLLAGSAFSESLDYWKCKLAEMPAALALPGDFPRPALATNRGGRTSFAFDAELTQAVKNLSRREAATVFMTLLAVWQILIARLSGETDIVIGTPVAGRDRPEIANMIGLFANTLALRSKMSEDLTFQDVLRQARRTAVEAYSHQDVPFEKVVQTLFPERNLSRNPLFQVVFGFQHRPAFPVEMSGVTVRYLSQQAGTAKFDLTLSMKEAPTGFQGWLEYNTDIFAPATADRIIAEFKQLLESFVADQQQKIGSPSSFTRSAQRQIPVNRNQACVDWNGGPLHEAKSAQASQESTTSPTIPVLDLEQTVAKIYSEVLQIERIGLDESFFEMGGNSLFAVQAQSRINRELDLRIPLLRIFEAPTVRSLSARIRADYLPETNGAAMRREIAPVKPPKPVHDGGLQNVATPLTRRVFRFLAFSDHWLSRFVRRSYFAVKAISLPAPRLVVKPLRWSLFGLRSVYYFLFRVCICEPIFKSYFRRYGRGFHSGVYLPWIQGPGDIIIGDDVKIDGKCHVTFAARYAENPILSIGNRTGIMHNSMLTIGKRISIGDRCRIASDVWMFDSGGHSLDADVRATTNPVESDTVRPIEIGDDVWIGRRCIVYPGVKIGAGSVIAPGSVVMSSVPPYSLVSGHPAKVVGNLQPPIE